MRENWTVIVGGTTSDATGAGPRTDVARRGIAVTAVCVYSTGLGRSAGGAL